MELRKFESIMLEIEELSKDKEKNQDRINELVNLLKQEKEYYADIDLKEVKEKLNEDLSIEEYKNTKDELKEKKLFAKYDKQITEVIEGNYLATETTKRVNRRRTLKGVAITAAFVGVSTLAIVGLSKKSSKNENKNNTSVQVIENTTEKLSTESTLENLTTESTTLKQITEAVTEDLSDLTIIKVTEDGTVHVTTEGTTERQTTEKTSEKRIESTTERTSESTTTERQTTERTTESTTEKTSESTTEKTTELTTEGTTEYYIDIEPTTIIIDTTVTTEDVTDYVIEDTTETTLPPTDIVIGDDETTYFIFEDTTEYSSEGTTEYSSEETTESSLPSLDDVEGDDEITYDITSNKVLIKKLK